MENEERRTILTIKQGPKVDFGGSVRSMGYRRGMRMTSPFGIKKRTLISVKHNVGAATLLRGSQKCDNSELLHTCLIHMLAKHETPINASKTLLGRVPAILSTLVMRTRSIAVLLRADAIVNPPINSIMVGENMTENIYLGVVRVADPRGDLNTYLVASGGVKRVTTPSSSVLRITRKQTKSNGVSIDVTNRGMACLSWLGVFQSKQGHPTSVAHNIVAKTRIAKHLLASSPSTLWTCSRVRNTAIAIAFQMCRRLSFRRPKGVGIWTAFASCWTAKVPPTISRWPSTSPLRSRPIICLHTVSRSQAMFSR